ncbi:hypothetical protein CIB48_g2791 [Xylaria polymorpha]|nr:hypothetical protein CIB48_g2791 [Xylaria polymorpha]
MESLEGASHVPYGRRLIPHVIDEIAHEEPQREAFQIPISAEPKDGWASITFKSYANAIDRCAHKIVEICGRAPEHKFPTIAYIGPQDARYVVLMVAAIKVGWQALYISPRNSQEGQINLFEKTDCRVLWFPSSFRKMVQPWLEERHMETFEVDSLESWFSMVEVPHVPFNRTFEQAEWEPLCLPYPPRLEWIHTLDTGLDGESKTTLSANFVIECLMNMDAESAVLPPSILEDISQSEEGMAVLKNLNMVAFGGGNLARETGDRLSQPDLWQYFIINRELFGVDWRKTDGDACELVIVRKDKTPGLQGFFYTFPDLNEYSTNDLFVPHPSLPDHWAYHGRADNVIVFSNGEKLNPITIEGIVQDHPRVKGAIVVGSNKFQPALLLEPFTHPKNQEEERALIDDVWPLIEKANSETVAHGQIIRDLVAIADQEKPFLRTGKGTIQRAATLSRYNDDIDRLYGMLGDITHLEVPKLDVKSEESLSQSIIETLDLLARKPELEPETNFFAAGIDSLQVINVSRLLRAGLAAAGYATELPPRIVYNNPTPRRLATYILHTIIRGGAEIDTDREGDEREASKLLYERYTQQLIQGQPGRPNASDEGQTVLLTGSTGALGSYLLDQLVRSPAVARVVCLNRGEDGGVERQAKAMKERDLVQDYSQKAEFYHADLSRGDFGLPKYVYENLSREADRACATWRISLPGPENASPSFFISSVSTADRWDTSKGPVPEERLEDWDLPGNGYGRSKMIGSMVLEDAGKVGDFPTASIRVGQIAGPESNAGAWAPQEWLPSIVASSLYMSALPKELGRADRVDWVPIERIAKLVLDVSGAGNQRVGSAEINGYFHGVNPSVSYWRDLAPAVQQFYAGRIKELVSFKDWVARLEKSQVVDANPGVKLVDTYRAMSDDSEAEPVIFGMQRAASVSLAIREAPPITPQLMKHWCTQWQF